MELTDRPQRGVLSGKLEEISHRTSCICAYTMATDNVVKAGGSWVEGRKGRNGGHL